MPIRIHNTGARSAIRIVCDHCGKVIEKASEGNVEWDISASSEWSEVFFIHKRCSASFESALGQNARTASIDLTDLPIRLAANLGMPVVAKPAIEGIFMEYELKGLILSLD